MSSIAPSKKQRLDIKYYAGALYELENCNTTNTITFNDFSGDENLKKCVLMNEADGSEVTCTISKNLVTITGSVSAANLVALVFGRLA